MYAQEILFEDESKVVSRKPLMVKDLPYEDQPRNKLALYGAACLSNTELLALLIGQGTREESELRLAEKVLIAYRDLGIQGIIHMSVEELAGIEGMTKAKSVRILAAVELGHRLSVSSAKLDIVHGPEDAAHFAMPHFRFETREHFAVMLLNTKNHIIAMPEVSKGSLTASIVHPREVFEEAVRHAAASIILMHNHPSGDPAPSREDIAVTRRLVKCGEMMDIPVLDHIILGDNRFVSLKEKNLMN